MPITVENLQETVAKIVQAERVTDMHTHLFAPELGDLLLSGADELMEFHYVISEAFRVHKTPYEEFWALSKPERAQIVWNSLFVENTPLSEAASGIVEIAKAFGCDMSQLSLETLRQTLSDVPTDAYIERVLDIAGVEQLVMTNDPFDPAEHAEWARGLTLNPRFHAALRLDQLLNHFDSAAAVLAGWGYDVSADLSGKSVAEVARFLSDWTDKMNPIYLAFSAADDFQYPEQSARGRILQEAILPLCAERNLPLSLMIGSRRGVNPALKLAGDSLGKASMRAIEALCANHPENKFLVTLLSRESQHELVVTARKFHNLMIFGCWWFVNTDTLVTEITRMRMELLGPTFVPQHSDARVLEHVIYKWQRARSIVTRVLTDKYRVLLEQGWSLTEKQIQRDVNKLFNQNFWDFVNR
ncbi:glucuronate isomerase [Alicyclobacillus fodiniaquatilis]|uniref:Glucuronate isomerase n=1 Tax=Alicyclobacillus fodiniaquatilis TaxID=1661150 RepID=A0ABW4JHI0_9BACL